MRYELWALERITEKSKCRVEPSMKCLPLRNDFICRACYEGENPAALPPFYSCGGSAEEESSDGRVLIQ